MARNISSQQWQTSLVDPYVRIDGTAFDRPNFFLTWYGTDDTVAVKSPIFLIEQEYHTISEKEAAIIQPTSGFSMGFT
jgi:hypothetical protein